MWHGKILLETGKKEKALKYFQITENKSSGRVWNRDRDAKYVKFFQKESKNSSS